MAERTTGPWGTVRISKWVGSRFKPLETVQCPTRDEARRVAASVEAKGLHANVDRYRDAHLAGWRAPKGRAERHG